MNITILDCTLRDGGYYNNWDFETEVVDEYLNSIAESNIEYVELGFRNFEKGTFLGAFAYTSEEFLNNLNLPAGPKYGVMIDAKTILESKYSIKDAIDKLFTSSSQSKICFVRVAAHFDEVEKSHEIITRLKTLGYFVGFNLMQAGGKSSEFIKSKVKVVSEWDNVDVLYFADSLGNMGKKEVCRIINAIRSHWSGELGIHTHNNMGKGLENSISALEAGAEWIDSTITGMGRGAGNTQTENLLAHLDNMQEKYNPKPIYELVIRHFESMQKKYGWGSNLLYFLGAQNDVHPTYIQNLLSSPEYGKDEVIGAIDYLSKLEGTASYNGDTLNSAINFTTETAFFEGGDDVKGIFNDKNVLIVTNAPTVKKYNQAIVEYIERVKPIVISVNISKFIPEEMIDFYVISHNSKFLSDYKNYSKLKSPIILPKCRFSSCELKELDGLTLIDYGIEVKSSCFKLHGTYVTIPYDITSAYILAVLLESSVNSIKAVGFDGYAENDSRQQEMVDFFSLYRKNKRSCNITSLTPSTYPISKGSIYAPTFK